MMTAAAAVGAVAAAADGLLDEDRTNRKEHDSHYDQSQNYITNTHGQSLLSNAKDQLASTLIRRRPSVESALAGLRNSRKMISAMNAMATTVPIPKVSSPVIRPPI